MKWPSLFGPLLCATTFSTFVSENSALGAEHGVGEHVALVVEVILAPLKLSTDYSPLLPKQSKIASPGIAYGSGMKNQAIGFHEIPAPSEQSWDRFEGRPKHY